MSKIKVLVVDDSPMIRQALKIIFDQDDEFEVVGLANNGIDAKNKVMKTSPDVITLDIEMPKMNGLEFLERLMAKHPIPVVMVSSTTTSGAENTIKALELGAVDYIAKPVLSEGQSIFDFKDEILSKVKVASKVNIKRFAHKGMRQLSGKSTKTHAAPIHEDIKPKYVFKKKIIAIGASTGGTDAILKVLTRLPKRVPGIVIVQHMPQYFTKAFASRLNSVCEIEVKEATDGDKIEPGTALVAPGDYHMVISNVGETYFVRLNQDSRINQHRPSVDVLFDSVAKKIGDKSIGILLTGMGKDGANGLAAMKGSGAYTIAQDEDSCIVFGMPREAIKLGGAVEIVSLNNISNKILSKI